MILIYLIKTDCSIKCENNINSSNMTDPLIDHGHSHDKEDHDHSHDDHGHSHDEHGHEHGDHGHEHDQE